MSVFAEKFEAETNVVTGIAASRATQIMSSFDFDPKIVAEVYDAVLVAKAEGQSETAVFERFAQQYNIGPDLKAEIEAKMSSAQSVGLKTNGTTTMPLSRATKIMDGFNFDPKIVGEIYDAVLVAKAEGTSESAVFDQFATKYNIGADLKNEIEAKMGMFD